MAKSKTKFLGWIDYPRANVPSHSDRKYVSCGRLTASYDGSNALLFMWMLPPPILNTRTGSFEIKAFCQPSPEKVAEFSGEVTGVLPCLDGDIMMVTEKFVPDNEDKEILVKKKIGYITSRNNETTGRQYYVMYFLGNPLVKMTENGSVCFHIHLDSYDPDYD